VCGAAFVEGLPGFSSFLKFLLLLLPCFLCLVIPTLRNRQVRTTTTKKEPTLLFYRFSLPAYSHTNVHTHNEQLATSCVLDKRIL
jgi:hypothetical protein